MRTRKVEAIGKHLLKVLKFLIVVVAASLAAFAGAATVLFYFMLEDEQEQMEQTRKEGSWSASPRETFISQCVKSWETASSEAYCEIAWDNAFTKPIGELEIATYDEITKYLGYMYLECLSKRPDLSREQCLKDAGDLDKPWLPGYQERWALRCQRVVNEIETRQGGFVEVIGADHFLLRNMADEEFEEVRAGLHEERDRKKAARCANEGSKEEYLKLVTRIRIAESEFARRLYLKQNPELDESQAGQELAEPPVEATEE